MDSWFTALWFFLPAGFANMVPVFASRLPLLRNWKAPLDFGKSFRGTRILGNNKTIRGLACGTLAAIFLGVLQSQLRGLEPGTSSIWIVAGALGFGALFGDFFESFLKRQKGIVSGDRWFPFDQLDYIVGGLLFVWPFANLTLSFVLQIVILYFGLHLLTAYIGYRLGLKDKPV